MRFLKKFIMIFFCVMFAYIFGIVFFFDQMKYINQRNLMIPNRFGLPIIFLFFAVFVFKKRKKDFSDKKYFTILIAMSLMVLGIQFIYQIFGYFTQTWDSGHMIRTVNHFARYGNIDDMAYMTRYPNNSMLTFILILIRSIPYIGRTNLLILMINAIVVNLAGVFTSLTVRNITKKNGLSLFVYIVLIPLFLLSPWILVYYSDTFASLAPILVLYIYSKDKKDYRDYFFICFIAFLGYYIKPTVIIVLMAIVLAELIFNYKSILNYKKHIKVFKRNSLACLLAVLVVIGINSASKVYVLYYDAPNVVKFNLVHFIAMGLNDETDGIYNDRDVGDTMSMGVNQNFKKIENRIFNRSIDKHIHFFAKKTLVNFNDGVFAWGHEGCFFCNVRKSNNVITNFIWNIILPEGMYHRYYLLIMQWIWLLVLVFIPSILSKYMSKSEFAIILSIIGISLFLTIFEARARYLYCFAPVFFVAFTLGISRARTRYINFLDRKTM